MIDTENLIKHLESRLVSAISMGDRIREERDRLTVNELKKLSLSKVHNEKEIRKIKYILSKSGEDIDEIMASIGFDRFDDKQLLIKKISSLKSTIEHYKRIVESMVISRDKYREKMRNHSDREHVRVKLYRDAILNMIDYSESNDITSEYINNLFSDVNNSVYDALNVLNKNVDTK